jgi:hypothetical protein
MIILHGVFDEVHEKHLEKRRVNGQVDGFFQFVVYLSRAANEEMMIVFQEIFSKDNDVRRNMLPFIFIAFKPGQMEDAVDVAGQSAHVGQHIFEILSLIFFGKIVFEEGFQIQLKRCDRCFEFMGEVVDEILLITVKLKDFLVIYEAHEYTSKDNTSDQDEYQGHNPCSALKNEKGVEVQPAYEFLKPFFYFDIPVDTKK